LGGRLKNKRKARPRRQSRTGLDGDKFLRTADIIAFVSKGERQRRLAEEEKLKSDFSENLFDALIWEIEKRWWWAEEAGLDAQARVAIYSGATARLTQAVAHARQRELRL
jgi:hypothetical protein